MISLVAAAAQVAAQRKTTKQGRLALRDKQEQRARQEREAAWRNQARSQWAPAHDPAWLASAGLVDTFRTWAAAAAWADADPHAASALRKSEERLRRLHPHAMARYDRLRGDGAGPVDAMREAVPLFANEPSARPHPAGRTRQAISPAADGTGPWAETGITAQDREQAERDYRLAEDEQACRRAIDRVQAAVREQRGSELSPDELVTVLEAQTTLPAEVIERLARARHAEQSAVQAEQTRFADLDRAPQAGARTRGRHAAASLDDAALHEGLADEARAQAAGDRSAAQVAALSFPYSAADGIRAAARTGTAKPARQSAPRAVRPDRRPRLSPR